MTTQASNANGQSRVLPSDITKEQLIECHQKEGELDPNWVHHTVVHEAQGEKNVHDQVSYLPTGLQTFPRRTH